MQLKIFFAPFALVFAGLINALPTDVNLSGAELANASLTDIGLAADVAVTQNIALTDLIKPADDSGCVTATQIDVILAETSNKMAKAFAFISNLAEREHYWEDWFTRNAIARIHRAFPSRNVIIFHDLDSKVKFENPVHTHYELQIGWGKTQGYDIYLFDSGVFDLSGDGGYINWCFQGNYRREDTHVVFYPVGEPIPAGKRSLNARDVSSLALDLSLLPVSSFNDDDYDDYDDDRRPLTGIPSTPLYNLNRDLPLVIKNNNPDGWYLVQCRSADLGEVGQGVAYYETMELGRNVDQRPDDFAWLMRVNNATAGAESTHNDWKSQGDVVILDESNATVSWLISPGAAGDAVAANTSCGIAYKDQEYYWVYKDQGKKLFSASGWDCYPLFYVF